MKRFLMFFAMAVAAASAAMAVEISDADIERAQGLVGQMTLDEKLSFLSGKTDFSIMDCPRLGIPEVFMADGPQGIRNQSPHSTLYPAGIALAATFDHDLARRYGNSLGSDARARGVGILLGPGVNMYRSPLCGRNFEYFGEDPYLASEIASEYIQGVQEKGVIATIKHFAANNQEYDRHHVSSDVDPRTLHEIYFPTFRKAVEKAGVGAVMNSYNLLNGVHASENEWLNKTTLRDRWGFRGILMSDWNSVYSVVNLANNGLDLEMPGHVCYTPEKLKEALANGRITEKTIDTKLVHILSTLSAFGMLDRPVRDESIPLNNPASHATALEVARGAIVLLKNDGMLPLKGRTVVLGPNADTIPTGGGSGFVSPFTNEPLSRAMAKMSGKNSFLDEDVYYIDLGNPFYADAAHSVRGFKASYYDNKEMKGEPVRETVDSVLRFSWGDTAPAPGLGKDNFSARWTGIFTPEEDCTAWFTVGGDDGYRLYVDGKLLAADWTDHGTTEMDALVPVVKGRDYEVTVEYYESVQGAEVFLKVGKFDRARFDREIRRADNVVYCAGFDSNSEREDIDRPFELPEYQRRFIELIAETNPNLCVVLNAGGAVEMQSWIDKANAVVMAWYPGQEGGTALAEVLSGKISPSGKLPVSFEREPGDNPSMAYYYPDKRPKDECAHLEYGEGIFTGYRGYDRSGARPMYPFGHGLSYSTFEFSGLAVEPLADGSYKVSFDVRNTGKVPAAEVAQVYVGDVSASVPRPAKELKGFTKMMLKPGESRRAEVVLDKDAFAFFDIDADDFVVEPGEFIVSVGNSSANLPLKATVEVK